MSTSTLSPARFMCSKGPACIPSTISLASGASPKNLRWGGSPGRRAKRRVDLPGAFLTILYFAKRNLSGELLGALTDIVRERDVGAAETLRALSPEGGLRTPGLILSNAELTALQQSLLGGETSGANLERLKSQPALDPLFDP